MSLTNCRECDRLFMGSPTGLCPECYRKFEQDYDKVRKLLRERPGLSAEELAAGTGVELSRIIEFLRDGRLEAKTGLRCEMCGKSITTGRYCSDCQYSLSNQLKNSLSNRGGVGMRYRKD